MTTTKKVPKQTKRADDEGEGKYVLHKHIPGGEYYYRHYRSKETGKVVCVREDPPHLHNKSEAPDSSTQQEATTPPPDQETPEPKKETPAKWKGPLDAFLRN